MEAIIPEEDVLLPFNTFLPARAIALNLPFPSPSQSLAGIASLWALSQVDGDSE